MITTQCHCKQGCKSKQLPKASRDSSKFSCAWYSWHWQQHLRLMSWILFIFRVQENQPADTSCRLDSCSLRCCNACKEPILKILLFKPYPPHLHLETLNPKTPYPESMRSGPKHVSVAGIARFLRRCFSGTKSRTLDLDKLSMFADVAHHVLVFILIVLHQSTPSFCSSASEMLVGWMSISTLLCFALDAYGLWIQLKSAPSIGITRPSAAMFIPEDTFSLGIKRR